MTTTETSRSEDAETFDSLDPTTDRVIGTYPVHSETDVQTAVVRARDAAEWWSALGFAGRAHRLRQWKGVIARRIPELCALVSQETGKPKGDAQLEVILALEH